MLPIQILNLLLLSSRQLRIRVPRVSLAVIGFHPPQQCNTEYEDRGAGGEVEAVADRVIRCVGADEGPGRDQAALEMEIVS